jgi:hypothetical protein
MPRVNRVQQPSELDRLTVWRLAPSRAPDLAIETNAASRHRIRTWEKELTRQQRSCGCDQGAWGLVLGVATYLAFLSLRPGGWGHPGHHEAWVGAAVVAGTTTAGKFIGLALAQRRLRHLVSAVRAEWNGQLGDSMRSRSSARGTTCC